MSENNRKRGRPQKPYVTSRGEMVPGLRRRNDGRWIIIASGETFVEIDEFVAVARYKQWLAAQPRKEVLLPVPATEDGLKGGCFAPPPARCAC